MTSQDAVAGPPTAIFPAEAVLATGRHWPALIVYTTSRAWLWTEANGSVQLTAQAELAGIETQRRSRSVTLLTTTEGEVWECYRSSAGCGCKRRQLQRFDWRSAINEEVNA